MSPSIRTFLRPSVFVMASALVAGVPNDLPEGYLEGTVLDSSSENAIPGR